MAAFAAALSYGCWNEQRAGPLTKSTPNRDGSTTGKVRDEHVAFVGTAAFIQPREAPEPAAPMPGNWMDGNIYQLRVDDIRRCESQRPSAWDGAARPTALRIGVWVRVHAKIDQLFVSPRDLILENDGVIYQAQFATARAATACWPLMPQKLLRHRHDAAGFAIFELPADFVPAAQGPVLAYQPTRWGGAKRTAMRLPACLEKCVALFTRRRAPRSYRLGR